MVLPQIALPAGYRWRMLTPDDQRLVTELDTWAFPSAIAHDDMDATPSPLTWERAIAIEAEGFVDRTIENIIVTADECHVIPVVRTYTLTPE